MKIFLTGAAGFIGSHLAERLAARGDDVLGFDNFDIFYPRRFKERNLMGLLGSPRFQLVQGDIRSVADLDRGFRQCGGSADVVVHLAALAGVRPSLVQPALFHEVNVLGTIRLQEAARRVGVRRLVFASSSSVYGADSQVPFSVDDACARPLSPYAATKRAGELGAWSMHHLHGWAVTCLRLFTVYGPRQRPDLAIHKFTELMTRGQPVQLYGADSARDYTYVDDIVSGIMAAIDQQASERMGHFRTYNLGGARTTTLPELLGLLGRALGLTPTVVRTPAQQGDMQQTLADLTLSERELGYVPKVPLEEGILEFVRWWRATANGGAGPVKDAIREATAERTVTIKRADQVIQQEKRT